MEIKYELFKEYEQKFDDFLYDKSNERIIFSSKFGSGKSTFLRHYFKNRKDKFNAIHLYPVNYSVLNNEDIFTYIKYDILFDLISEYNVILETSKKYGLLEAMPYFIRYRWFSFLSLIPLVSDKLGGRNMNTLIEGFNKLYEEYKKFSKPKDSDLNLVQDFQKVTVNHEGNVYENNAITEIIKSELEKLKGKENVKENILILDDLDRMDPDHIFRILNVFSAHFDERNKYGQEQTNKFGFDKVIIVCDISNIKNIFKTKYGINTDFNGYIDKFYSREIFNFSINNLIIGFVNETFNCINTGKFSITQSSRNTYFEREVIYKVLTYLVEVNVLNIRTLFKFYKRDLTLSLSNRHMKIGKEEFHRYDFCILILIDLLELYFNGRENLIEQFSKLRLIGDINIYNENDYNSNNIIIGELLYLLKLMQDEVIEWDTTTNIPYFVVNHKKKDINVYNAISNIKANKFYIEYGYERKYKINIIELLKEVIHKMEDKL